MQARAGAIALGSGVTTALLVSVAVIEVLEFELSAIIGLPLGVIAGLFVGAGLWIGWDAYAQWIRLLASGYAAFGLTMVMLFGLRYINVGRGY